MSEDDRKTLGQKLKEAREYLGYSQDEVAKALKVPRSAVSLIESGQRKVELFELKKLSQLYQRPITEFTGETESVTPESVGLIARLTSGLTEKDRVEVLKYAEFLSMKSKMEKEDE